MRFKSFDTVLQPDQRFEGICGANDGSACAMTLRDLHDMLDETMLAGSAPSEVQEAFDRARHVMLYAFFDYDLLVVGELQALGAFELALKHIVLGHGGQSHIGMGKLVKRARAAFVLPQRAGPQHPVSDRIDSLVAIRDALSHGTSEVHSPAMALTILEGCAEWINYLFPPRR